MPDTASPTSTQLDNGELRHTLSVHDVGAALVAAGVPRSHRQIIRYCETAMLDAVKCAPTGAQRFVSPVSLPKSDQGFQAVGSTASTTKLVQSVERFGKVMREKLTTGEVPFRKAYLGAIVDRIEVGDGLVRIVGRKDVLERAVLAKQRPYRGVRGFCSSMARRTG